MAEGGKKNVPCIFFKKGACRNGDACPFSHDPNTPDAPPTSYSFVLYLLISYGSTQDEMKKAEMEAGSRPDTGTIERGVSSHDADEEPETMKRNIR